MGVGYSVKCKRCGYEDQFLLGSGRMHPYAYNKLVSAIKSGKYGEELQEYFNIHKGAVVDDERFLYRCPECNKLIADYKLSLYMRKGDKEPKNGYWTKWLIIRFPEENEAAFVGEYTHRCPDCGARMYIVKETEMDNLTCPECGEQLIITNEIMWD